MVCTFRPPGVSSASANSLRARARMRARDCSADALGSLASSAASSSAVQSDECLEHAVRHVGGRRLGEGDAQDFRRRGAVSSSRITRCAQHMGLARAGIGRHPGRDGRIGGLLLRLDARRAEAACARVHSELSVVFAAGQRPFLDARQMIVVAVVRPTIRAREGAIRRSAGARIRRRPRAIAPAPCRLPRRAIESSNSISFCSPARIAAAQPQIRSSASD